MENLDDFWTGSMGYMYNEYYLGGRSPGATYSTLYNQYQVGLLRVYWWYYMGRAPEITPLYVSALGAVLGTMYIVQNPEVSLLRPPHF